uniref:Uncharacterized protein n=1 Tax=Parascaris univalens TaxID=6257 RepID=A0A915BNG3_PARUN
MSTRTATTENICHKSIPTVVQILKRAPYRNAMSNVSERSQVQTTELENLGRLDSISLSFNIIRPHLNEQEISAKFIKQRYIIKVLSNDYPSTFANVAFLNELLVGASCCNLPIASFIL